MMRICVALLFFIALSCGLAAADLTDLIKLRSTSKTPIIPFKNAQVKKYIFEAERHYHLYIHFEPAEEGTCPYCDKLKEQVLLVSTLYNRSLPDKNPNDPHIFFVVVNPKTAKDIFAQFNIQALPLLAHLPAGAGRELTLAPFPLTGLESLTEPFQLVEWIQSTSGVKVNIPLPFFKRPEVRYTLLALLVLLFLWKLPFFLRNYNHPMVGFLIFMIVYCVVMNGTVWNAIHEPPFWGGQANFFLPGMHSQFKIEGIIMATLFVATMICWVLLTNWVPFTFRYLRIPAACVVITCMVFLMNTIFRIFSHLKMGGGYPFYFDIPALFA